MKSAVATVGMFAALANAYQYPRHNHFHRSNGTADAGQTTLTVYTTDVHTVTSCKPTVTNCPARQHGSGGENAYATLPASDLTTDIITNTVVLTTTICPVAEASKVKSSIIAKASTCGCIPGTTVTGPLTTSPPLGTGYYPGGPKETGAPGSGSGSKGEGSGNGSNGQGENGSTTYTTQIVTDKVVTVTLGNGKTIVKTVPTTIPTTVVAPITPAADKLSGEGAQPTTTHVQSITEAVTVTLKKPSATEVCTVGQPCGEKGSGSGSSGKGTNGNGGNGGNSGNKGENTIAADKYQTKGTSGSGSGSSNGECTPETVTVTAPASTVYVTVGGKGSGAAKTGDSNPAVTTGPQADETTGDDDEYCDTETDEATATSFVYVTPVPYPTGARYPTNGTVPSGSAQTTGFARMVR